MDYSSTHSTRITMSHPPIPPIPASPTRNALRRHFVQFAEEFERKANEAANFRAEFPMPMPMPIRPLFGDFPKMIDPMNLHDNSSGYHSSSSNSSLFHSLHRTSSEKSLYPPNGQLRQAIFEKPSRVRFMRESVNNILDQIDTRVSFLRETAVELEDEKRKLLNVLHSMKSTKELTVLSEVDKEEIFATADRLLQRLDSVEVLVSTTRNKEQENALEAVNKYLDGLVQIFHENIERAVHMCRAYLNTCSSENTFGVIDDQFQKAIIACTADDQKKVRKRLESLNLTFSHALNNFAKP